MVQTSEPKTTSVQVKKEKIDAGNNGESDDHHQDRQWDYNLKNRIRKYDNLGEVLQLMRRVVSVLS